MSAARSVLFIAVVFFQVLVEEMHKSKGIQDIFSTQSLQDWMCGQRGLSGVISRFCLSNRKDGNDR